VPNIRRVVLDDVVPLELWDLLVDGAVISERMGVPEFPRLLVEAIQTLLSGDARTRSPPSTDLLVCREASFTFVGGGGALRPGLQEFLAGSGLRTYVTPEGSFAGEAGGWEILTPWRGQGIVVDLGQTSIKVSSPHARFRIPRDPALLPYAGGLRALLHRDQREQFVRFVGEAIHGALDRNSPAFHPRAIVVGLPCQIDEHGVPGPSSYEPLEGDETLVRDACRRAGLEDIPILVLNDAEMAAVSARVSAGIPSLETVLVLTLGSGLGGALLRRDPVATRAARPGTLSRSVSSPAP
jgi:hypothetical protein